jgi:plastocyanin
MRRLLFVLAAALALTLPVNALAATKTVNIYGAIFQPATVTIKTGDAVKWVNKDNANHQIYADHGEFVSAILKPGQSFAFTFKAAGTYTYKDELHPTIRGTIVVKGAPPTRSQGTRSRSPASFRTIRPASRSRSSISPTRCRTRSSAPSC